MTKEEIHKLVDKHTLWYESIGRQIIDENRTDDLKDELVKLFSIPVVVGTLKCDCIHSGSCRYEEVILNTKEVCRHKE